MLRQPLTFQPNTFKQNNSTFFCPKTSKQTLSQKQLISKCVAQPQEANSIKLRQNGVLATTTTNQSSSLQGQGQEILNPSVRNTDRPINLEGQGQGILNASVRNNDRPLNLESQGQGIDNPSSVVIQCPRSDSVSGATLLIGGVLTSLLLAYSVFGHDLSTEQMQILSQSALVTLGASMFGYAPYLSQIKGDKLEGMSAMGAGLLISMALTMIIPSGAEQFVFHEIQQHQMHMQHMGQDIAIADCCRPSVMPIGISIMLGFGSLYLLDLFQRRSTEIKVKDNKIEDVSSMDGNLALSCMHSNNGPQQAITGLVIHSVADGLAMGAGALSGNLQLGFMVGMAMILHRGPMAFGLSSYLRQMDYPEEDAMRGVWAFSLACPLTALAIYCFMGGMVDNELISIKNIALTMLFSGGSFLYVAFVHILPNVTKNIGKLGTTIPYVVGMFLPIAMMSFMGNHHHH